MTIAKVLPIQSVINNTRRRADDYWWEGEDKKAIVEEKYLDHLEQLQERGELWYPNF